MSVNSTGKCEFVDSTGKWGCETQFKLVRLTLGCRVENPPIDQGLLFVKCACHDSIFIFFFTTLGLELSDTEVYEPEIRALLGTASPKP